MAYDAPGATLTMGVDVVLFFMEEDNAPQLVVGNDSLTYDNGEYYVYVKGEGDTNVKRIVEVGASDGNYTIVKSGLEEGELVFYRNDALVPKNYDTAVASIGDYRETQSTEIVEFCISIL
jgi:Membrane-fusion protein